MIIRCLLQIEYSMCQAYKAIFQKYSIRWIEFFNRNALVRGESTKTLSRRPQRSELMMLVAFRSWFVPAFCKLLLLYVHKFDLSSSNACSCASAGNVEFNNTSIGRRICFLKQWHKPDLSALSCSSGWIQGMGCVVPKIWVCYMRLRHVTMHMHFWQLDLGSLF
jgi:hypothetical protein